MHYLLNYGHAYNTYYAQMLGRPEDVEFFVHWYTNGQERWEVWATPINRDDWEGVVVPPAGAAIRAMVKGVGWRAQDATHALIELVTGKEVV